MKITLPITFDLPIDEAALENLQINLGVARAEHYRALELEEDGFPKLSDELVSAAMDKKEAREKLWAFLKKNISLPEESPQCLKSLLCHSVLCRLFRVDATISSYRRSGDGSVAFWELEIRLTDRTGKCLGNSFSGSVVFDPENYQESLSAYLGAAADATRECVRSAFALSEDYDEQDTK